MLVTILLYRVREEDDGVTSGEQQNTAFGWGGKVSPDWRLWPGATKAATSQLNSNCFVGTIHPHSVGSTGYQLLVSLEKVININCGAVNFNWRLISPSEPRRSTDESTRAKNYRIPPSQTGPHSPIARCPSVLSSRAYIDKHTPIHSD